MSSISAMHTGIQGIQHGMNALRQDAQKIASATTSPQNEGLAVEPVSDALVSLKLDELQVESSVKVVQAASDMIGTLLDIKA